MDSRAEWNRLFDCTHRTTGAADPELQDEGKTPQEAARTGRIEPFRDFAKRVEENEIAGPIERRHLTRVEGVKHLPIRTQLRAPARAAGAE